MFDILVGPNGSTVGAFPLTERRTALEAFGEKAAIAGKLIVTPCTRDLTEATEWLNDFNRDGRDGVVAKRLDEKYLSGERAMIKVKRLRTADCVIGGFRYLSGGYEVGSLLLGLYNAQGLLDHVGFTSTLANDERAALTRKLRALQGAPGFTGRREVDRSRWSTERSGEWTPLRPELVVEVRYDHVTGDRFRHGTKLLRFRPDKPPPQCSIRSDHRAASSSTWRTSEADKGSSSTGVAEARPRPVSSRGKAGSDGVRQGRVSIGTTTSRANRSMKKLYVSQPRP